MILFGWVLWHINHVILFNVKSVLYIYIYQIYDYSTHLVGNIFWAIFWSTVKWFHLFLSDTNSSIYYQSFICTQLNAFNFNTNDSKKHQRNIKSFVYTQLNDQTILFQTIHFSILKNLNNFKYCYVSLMIHLNISYLFTHIQMRNSSI